LVEPRRWDDGDLKIPLELLDELEELGRSGDSPEILGERDVKIGLEGDVVEEHRSSNVDLGLWTEDCDAVGERKSQFLIRVVSRRKSDETHISEADSLLGKRTTELVFDSMSWMKMDFSPRRVRWYRRGIETVSTV